jgi:hypothetical protein
LHLDSAADGIGSRWEISTSIPIAGGLYDTAVVLFNLRIHKLAPMRLETPGGFEDGLAGGGVPLIVVPNRGQKSASPAAMTPNLRALRISCAAA